MSLIPDCHDAVAWEDVGNVGGKESHVSAVDFSTGSLLYAMQSIGVFVVHRGG